MRDCAVTRSPAHETRATGNTTVVGSLRTPPQHATSYNPQRLIPCKAGDRVGLCGAAATRSVGGGIPRDSQNRKKAGGGSAVITRSPPFLPSPGNVSLRACSKRGTSTFPLGLDEMVPSSRSRWRAQLDSPLPALKRPCAVSPRTGVLRHLRGGGHQSLSNQKRPPRACHTTQASVMASAAAPVLSYRSH
jgi:hypothetical protein